ncbi:hypothetical protein TREMEDRAFT_56114 [Tremella mesenterica DSM 1558]|uniref:uncharacterized protein n=1 Tax=Tremella mesenterica (strain ATCC 24925 / CBS 8224 / DSM 1558 / NBRC 9311 / NRRL Y-6157 / RJB 2259-6 / UBC 559-6) TaxID=578456 RepID=UPI0003F496D7|nr:uncharacterized protein TREMEDRAFT_56114 [Tremella mesenterica DSM 1558]EIW73056.1 hypothetical protein TREMEDRAFT_56114 [Tremella mesenterica DSM 1558]
MAEFDGTLSSVISTRGPFGNETLPIFASGDLDSKKAILFIGGLGNGLGDVPFTYALSVALGRIGWKLVQMHWSSAHEGFGTGSIDRDRDEMECVVKHLRFQGHEKIVIMGHSTGSQDVINYLSSPSLIPSATAHIPWTDPGCLASMRAKVDGGIMQAPVSDREYHVSADNRAWLDALPVAEKMLKEGNGDELLPKPVRERMGVMMTAYRAWSLLAVGGYDDYFSADIPIHDSSGKFCHPLSQSFGKLSSPALALYSGKDEFGQPGDRTPVLQRWAEVSGGKLEWKIIPGAGHAIPEPSAQVMMCGIVTDWLKRVVEN